MSDALLQVENLKKYFMVPDGMLHAVDDVSFTLDIGETLGVVGESGCGKSTLGKTILQLIRPTSGKIVFDGEDISKVDNKKFVELRPKMQMIFQDPLSSLNPRMSVSQQIAEPLLIHKVCPDKEALNKRVLELMDTVGLARRYSDTYPHELDGGQDLQKEKGMAYMFITHDLSVVKHISDHISVMYLGQMIEKAPTAELFSHTWHPYTKALLSAIPIPSIKNKKKRELLKGELTSPINPPDACRFAPRCNYACEECFKGTPKLEELSKDHFVACKRVRELNGL